MYNISIWGDGLDAWEGGIQVIINLIRNLTNTSVQYNIRIQISLILFNDCKNVDSIICRVKTVNPDIIYYFVEDTRRAKFILENEIGADLVLPVLCNVLRGVDIPCVSYIPDLQEEYLPDFFGREEIQYRRKKNLFCLKKTSDLLLMSKTVKDDLSRFYNIVTHRPRIWCQPCAPLSDPLYWNDEPQVLTKYSLPEKYFVISNQFWVHKNHITAFKAVKEIRDRGVLDVSLICTGDTTDYRNATHIKELEEYIRINGLSDNIRILGYIPKLDQIELLKHALAVVQPTLFEGGAGGFSGQEAIAYDRPLIISNIQINLELADIDNICFFDPLDYKTLAMYMKKRIKQGYTESSLKRIKEIYNNNATRLAVFYYGLINGVLGEHNDE